MKPVQSASERRPAENAAPQFSVVTVCLNNERTIADTVRTVREQRGIRVEHIVKDGGSTDRTTEIVRELNPEAKVVVSTDTGIYDAMNQGFAHCRGEVIAFLNADDFYAAPDVLQSVLQEFRDPDCAIVYGDLSIVDSKHRLLRRWKSGPIEERSLKGRQLPHPAFFVRRSVLAELDQPFDSSFQISADLKQQLILVEKLGLRTGYLPRVTTVMRAGGRSSRQLSAFVLGWRESARAYREVHGRSGWVFVARKVLAKLPHMRLQRRPL